MSDKVIEKQERIRTIDILWFALLCLCIFVHLVLVFNKTWKYAYEPDDKFFFAETEYIDYYIRPWWALNGIYLVYVISAALYYLGYMKLPKRKR